MSDRTGYALHVRWSDEDDEWVATVEEYPSLSWLAPTPEIALLGLARLLAGESGDSDRFDALAERLGPTLTAFLSCAHDATGRGADPERLGAARDAWAEITRTHSDDVARNWFIAANPRLSGDAPVERLREGHTKSVISAARGFAEGDVMGA